MGKRQLNGMQDAYDDVVSAGEARARAEPRRRRPALRRDRREAGALDQVPDRHCKAAVRDRDRRLHLALHGDTTSAAGPCTPLPKSTGGLQANTRTEFTGASDVSPSARRGLRSRARLGRSPDHRSAQRDVYLDHCLVARHQTSIGGCCLQVLDAIGSRPNAAPPPGRKSRARWPAPRAARSPLSRLRPTPPTPGDHLDAPVNVTSIAGIKPGIIAPAIHLRSPII